MVGGQGAPVNAPRPAGLQSTEELHPGVGVGWVGGAADGVGWVEDQAAGLRRLQGLSSRPSPLLFPRWETGCREAEHVSGDPSA